MYSCLSIPMPQSASARSTGFRPLPEARAAISGRAVADRGAQQRQPYMMQLATIDIFAAGEEWGRLRRPGVVEMIDKRLSRLSDALGDETPLDGDRFTAGDLADDHGAADHLRQGSARPLL